MLDIIHMHPSSEAMCGVLEFLIVCIYSQKSILDKLLKDKNLRSSDNQIYASQEISLKQSFLCGILNLTPQLHTLPKKILSKLMIFFYEIF